MDNNHRYAASLHAVQSGVAQEMEIDGRKAATEPKHLRVGINVAMCDHAGLVSLLIERGVITKEEYTAAIADEMEREKTRYENRLSEHFGVKITLA